ncbi:MAG: hypothetical protein BGO41_02080 [Clostridiales bacterium 38-18]|nr:MAG: hypothetical protein BGO41_02080 [Clostridiales bacterium 38-18]
MKLICRLVKQIDELEVPNRMRHSRGISLVEIILSIAVLALLSTYVVQMFITSQTLNEKARALDESVYISESILEAIEVDSALDHLKNLKVMKHAVFTNENDYNVIKIYFDKDFEAVDAKENYRYLLQLKSIETQALAYSKSTYELQVVDIESKEAEPIYEIEMEKYR